MGIVVVVVVVVVVVGGGGGDAVGRECWCWYWVDLVRSFIPPSPALAQAEINKKEKPSQIFRMDSIPTKFFRLYIQKEGRGYLSELLSTFFHQLSLFPLPTSSSSSSSSSSSCPSPTSLGDFLPASTLSCFERFLRMLVGGFSCFPPVIASVLSSVSSLVVDKFGEGSER